MFLNFRRWRFERLPTPLLTFRLAKVCCYFLKKGVLRDLRVGTLEFGNTLVYARVGTLKSGKSMQVQSSVEWLHLRWLEIEMLLNEGELKSDTSPVKFERTRARESISQRHEHGPSTRTCAE